MSESDVIPPTHEKDGSLDEAIEFCVLELESDRGIDLESIIGRFPQWSVELTEFLENWSEMRKLSPMMVGGRQAQDEPDLQDANARSFGDYELLEKIGVGGMGVIYKARQISLDRVVALKMLVGEHQDNDRLRVEAESAAALFHPNIVSIYEIGEHENRLFFTMQLIDGCNLKEYLDETAVTPKRAAVITEILAGAVHYAHQRGTLHRDLKPANVMMDANGQPHITDFGLAKRIERDSELTRSGTILGTPGYMAPEQATGQVKNLTTTTDVYGLGAILYAMLTGEAPFTGDSSLEILRRVVDEPPTSPRVRHPDIHRDIETICLKCLEKSPELRYASPELLADDLNRFLSGQPVKARPVSTSERFWRWCRRNPAISILSAAVVALLIATAISSFFLAVAERNSRLANEERLREKLKLLTDVGIASSEKELARLNTRAALARSYLSNGLSEAEAGSHGDALLWFTELVELTRDDPDQLRENLLRSQNWLAHQPVPIAALSLNNPENKIEFLKQHDQIQFRPGNIPQLLCISRQAITVWDYRENKRWDLFDDFPDISAAAWSSNGEHLAVGLKDGKVELVDPELREVEHSLSLHEQPVEHLTFSAQNEILAVSSGKSVRLWDLAREKPVEGELVLTSDVSNLSFNRTGSRLVVVLRSKQANVYSVDEQINLLFDVPCRVGRTNENQRAFWPTFVKSDSLLLVMNSNGRELVLYRSDSGEPVGNLELSEAVYSVSVANDGVRIGTSSTPNAKLIRMSESPEQPRENAEPQADSDPATSYSFHPVSLLPHEDRVVSVDFRFDDIVATGGWDREVRIWKMDESSNEKFDIPPRRQLLAVLPHQARTRQVVFSPDGLVLATIQVDGLIRVWKFPQFESPGYKVPLKKFGSSIKLVDQDAWIIAGDSSWRGQVSNVSMHRLSDGEITGSTPGLSNEIDGQLLDSSCSADGQQLATIHANPVRTKAGLSLADGTAGNLRLWNWPAGTADGDAIPMPSEPRSVAFRPDGKQLAVCTAKMEIVLVDTESRSIESILRPFDESGNIATLRALDPVYYDNGRLAYSPDGATIVAWGGRDGAWVWDQKQRKLRFPCITNGGKIVPFAQFSPDGTQLAIAGGRNHIARVLDTRSGVDICHPIKHSSVVYAARFSPNGRQLITSCRDGEARVYDLGTGEIVTRHLLHRADIRQASFSNDARYLFTLGIDHLLRVWNTRDGSLALKPIGSPPWANQLLVSADSRYVLVGSGRQAVEVFDFLELQQEPSINVANLKSISELVSGKTVSNGAAVRLSSNEWYEKWLEYAAKSIQE